MPPNRKRKRNHQQCDMPSQNRRNSNRFHRKKRRNTSNENDHDDRTQNRMRNLFRGRRDSKRGRNQMTSGRQLQRASMDHDETLDVQLPDLDRLESVLYRDVKRDSSLLNLRDEYNLSWTQSHPLTSASEYPTPLPGPNRSFPDNQSVMMHNLLHRHFNSLATCVSFRSQHNFFSHSTVFQLSHAHQTIQYHDLVTVQQNENPSTCLINPQLDRMFLSMNYIYRVFRRQDTTGHAPPERTNAHIHKPNQLSHQFTAALNCEQVVDSKWESSKKSLFVGFVGDTSRIVKVEMGDDTTNWKEKVIWSSATRSGAAPSSLCSFDVGRHGRIALGLARSFKILRKGKVEYQYYAPFQSDITNIRFLSTNSRAFTTLARNGEFSLFDMRQKSKCFSCTWDDKPIETYHIAHASPYLFSVAFMDGKVVLYDCRMGMQGEMIRVHEPAQKPSLMFSSLRPVLHDSFLLHADPLQSSLHLYDLSQSASQDVKLFETQLPNRPVGMNYDMQQERIMCLTEDYTSHWFSWNGSERR
eukprot:CAMPEP_0117434544 /NCGR_PEP_ID=MMETSP0759-20121206/7_1 /TAXON_ID=63605 /ORGANISM="Percolomonas cosmopolitus, Strain WS" /LENGTH=525 /DNA_ID=CAMNT_0005226037 /DNA_START=100 /DNA_END=1677 /DNA_ORIENTATION=-